MKTRVRQLAVSISMSLFAMSLLTLPAQAGIAGPPAISARCAALNSPAFDGKYNNNSSGGPGSFLPGETVVITAHGPFFLSSPGVPTGIFLTGTPPLPGSPSPVAFVPPLFNPSATATITYTFPAAYSGLLKWGLVGSSSSAATWDVRCLPAPAPGLVLSDTINFKVIAKPGSNFKTRDCTIDSAEDPHPTRCILSSRQTLLGTEITVSVPNNNEEHILFTYTVGPNGDVTGNGTERDGSVTNDVSVTGNVQSFGRTLVGTFRVYESSTAP